ncbi:MAG: Ig-like domain-containing protein [Coprobacillus sp.]|nr:Ig-like domain-containing protein [Coprobacillus sp.]
MKKKFLLSACLALSLVLAGCSTSGGNSAIKGEGSVEGVRLTQDTFNVDIGETYFLKSFVEFTPTYPADQTYTLESSNEDIFTVDSEQGSFTGVSIGVGTLTLTTNDGGYTANATVIVGGGISEDVPDDAGDSTITYTNYTLVFTLYDENLQVQKALDGDTLYITGDYDGTWNSDGWWDWGGYTALTETTDASGNVAYSITLSSVIGGSHEFMICVGNSWNPIRSDNFTFTIATTAVSGGTHYYPLLNCYNFEEKFGEDPSATETEFYIVFLDSGSATISNTYEIQGGKAVFNGSTKTTGTNATTGTTNKTCIYTSTPGTLTSGQTDSYWIWVSDTDINVSTGTITIPKNDTGYAVYTVEYDLSSTSHQEDSTAGTWTTGVSSITEFIAAL